MHARTPLALAIACALVGCGSSAPELRPPNIVLIVADDLGWAGVGYHDAPIRTPHLDRLAAEGVALERFYVAPVCAPTRAGLLTGRYPIRFGMDTPGMREMAEQGLPVGEQTLADLLGRGGYAQRRIVGKWHLGDSSPDFHPLRRGFTGFYGLLGGHIDYVTHRRLPTPPRAGELDWFRDREPVEEEGYATTLLGEEAVRFIRSAPDGEPFFLYLPFNAPHMPEWAEFADLVFYRGLDMPERAAIYAGMITSMDRQIGAVLDALAERGFERDTLVWFLSDNGAKLAFRNLPLAGKKGEAGEGAIRVPAVVRWPAGLPGGRVETALASYVDVLPTCAAAAGIALPRDRAIDGIDLLPILRGSAPAPDRALYADLGAVVTRRWKLVGERLHDLDADPAEKRDVAAQHPGVRARLERERQRFLALRGAR